MIIWVSINLFISFLAGKDLSESRFRGQYLESWHELEAMENYKHTETKFWPQTLMFSLRDGGTLEVHLFMTRVPSYPTPFPHFPTLPDNLPGFNWPQFFVLSQPEPFSPNATDLLTYENTSCLSLELEASVPRPGLSGADATTTSELSYCARPWVSWIGAWTSSYLSTWILKSFSPPSDHSFMNCGLLGPWAKLPGFRPCLVTDLCPQNSLWSCPNFPVSWPFAWPVL